MGRREKERERHEKEKERGRRNTKLGWMKDWNEEREGEREKN